MLRRLLLTTLVLTVSGCTALGEVAYDMRADHESARCESNMSMADRQACLDRVRAVEKNASEIRKSREVGS
jgi:hypothetical protein